MTRLVLVDAQHLVRQGLRALLDAEPDLSVVAEGADGREALDRVARERPDVLVIDPAGPGLDVFGRLAPPPGGPRIVVVSMQIDPWFVAGALRRGATGFVFKGSTAADLFRAIRAAVEGRRVLGPPIDPRAVDDHLRRSTPEPADPYESLTAREREVLQLVAEGLTSAEASARLHISPRTVEIHRARLLRKLGLRSPIDLVRFALRRGLLTP